MCRTFGESAGDQEPEPIGVGTVEQDPEPTATEEEPEPTASEEEPKTNSPANSTSWWDVANSTPVPLELPGLMSTTQATMCATVSPTMPDGAEDDKSSVEEIIMGTPPSSMTCLATNKKPPASMTKHGVIDVTPPAGMPDVIPMNSLKSMTSQEAMAPYNQCHRVMLDGNQDLSVKTSGR